MHNLLQNRPTAYALPKNICAAMNLKNEVIVEALINSPRLRPHIDIYLTNFLGQIPQMSLEEEKVCSILLNLSPEDFVKISRIVAVFIQSNIIKESVDGHIFSIISNFLEDNDVLYFIRDNKIPNFSLINPDREITIEVLQEHSSYCEGYFLAILPENFRKRLLLSRPQGQLGEIRPIPDAAAKRDLYELIQLSYDYMTANTQSERHDDEVIEINDAES